MKISPTFYLLSDHLQMPFIFLLIDGGQPGNMQKLFSIKGALCIPAFYFNTKPVPLKGRHGVFCDLGAPSIFLRIVPHLLVPQVQLPWEIFLHKCCTMGLVFAKRIQPGAAHNYNIFFMAFLWASLRLVDQWNWMPGWVASLWSSKAISIFINEELYKPFSQWPRTIWVPHA